MRLCGGEATGRGRKEGDDGVVVGVANAKDIAWLCFARGAHKLCRACIIKLSQSAVSAYHNRTQAIMAFSTMLPA